MIWVIGDIHGMLDPLKSILTAIRLEEEPDDPVEKIIFIGDYIDHGPSSKEVIDLISRLDYNKVLLMGNHEDLAVRFFKFDTPMFEKYGFQWFNNGCEETLYSINDTKKIDELRNLIYKYKYADLSDKKILINVNTALISMPRKYKNFLYNLKYSHHEIIKVEGQDLSFNFFHSLPKPFIGLESQRVQNYNDFNNLLLDMARKDEYYAKDKQDKKKMIRNSREFINNSFIWQRDYIDEEIPFSYGGEIVIHGHTPTIGYEELYGYGEEYDNDGINKQFKSFPYKDMMPFLYSLSPEAFLNPIETRPYRYQRGPEYAGFKFFPDKEYHYLTGPEYGIEAINIDTGAVAGGALTALGLSPKYLAKNYLLLLSYPSATAPRLTRDKVKKIQIKFDKLGGPAHKKT